MFLKIRARKVTPIWTTFVAKNFLKSCPIRSHWTCSKTCPQIGLQKTRPGTDHWRRRHAGSAEQAPSSPATTRTRETPSATTPPRTIISKERIQRPSIGDTASGSVSVPTPPAWPNLAKFRCIVKLIFVYCNASLAPVQDNGQC